MDIWMSKCIILAVVAASTVFAQECRHPPPVSNYTNERYQGFWYEVGRIQTPGGGYYQRFCLCDTSVYTPDDLLYSGGLVDYSCRNGTTDGPLTTIQATLTPGEVPGNFDQRFFAFQKPADYNVIWLDDETAMEYDCTSTLGVVNYCVHLMSRTQSIPQEKLDLMIAFAESLDLNPEEIEYKPTVQEGCWN
ncbi:apolipoprotein D-like [Artemia franciscana]|uniref:apolipoprotein D-like n=1 Tax=Artemia franciscana TaxID=6661 RepID=UPI0032DBCAEF